MQIILKQNSLFQICFLVFYFFIIPNGYSQQIFNNPDMEGPNGNAIAPPSWGVCSGTPDVLPTNVPIFPSSGNSCIGMIINTPGIFEKVGQALPIPLDSTKCYSFDIDLKNGSGYAPSLNSPGRLAIWFGDSVCKKQFLAYTSPSIPHTPYRTYSVSFQPSNNFTHVVFEVISLNTPATNCSVVMDNITNETITSPFVELGNDTLLCFGDSLTLDASGADLTYRWSDNSNDSILVVSEPGLYRVTVTDINGCQGNDEILISFPDTLNLGNDTSICLSDSVLLSANVANSTYIWQDNSTDSVLIASTTGIYSVTVTTGNCIQIDSINIGVSSAFNLELGNDTLLCPGATLLLDATTNGVSYLWQDLSNSNTYLVDTPGKYFVEVTDGICTESDTINIEYADTLDLGNDISICSNDSILLNIPIANSSFLWQNGSTDSTLLAKDSGLYYVEVTTQNCIQSDSIRVRYFNTPSFDLGEDTVLCKNEILLLDVSTPNASYLWQDNSTNSTFTVNDSGTYTVQLLLNSCTYFDTIRVDYLNIDSINLGNDTSLCQNDSILLEVDSTIGKIEWNTGDTVKSIIVSQTGNYWVTISAANCLVTDTIRIDFISIAKPDIDLGEDTTLCPGDTIILDATWPNANYLWQDGSDSNLFVANNDGVYSVLVQDSICAARDSININFIQEPDLSFPSEFFCINEGLLVDFSLPNASYIWQDSSTNSSYLVKDSGFYWVEVFIENCVFYSDTVFIKERDCICDIEAPNIFTPNGDFINDDFFLETECILKAFKLQVYNRYGQLVFETSDINARWDGRKDGEKLSEGVYFYLLEYETVHGIRFNKRGSVQLIR